MAYLKAKALEKFPGVPESFQPPVSFVPFSSREARKQIRFVPTGEGVQKGYLRDEENTAEAGAIFQTPIAKGLLDTSLVAKEDQIRIRKGYLKGSRPPIALEYVMNYFIPGGDPRSPIHTPLNAETYREFCETMYKFFLEGSLLGVVSFDQPSYDDVYAVLSTNAALAIQNTKFPIKRGKTIKTTSDPRLGLDSSSFKATPFSGSQIPGSQLTPSQKGKEPVTPEGS